MKKSISDIAWSAENDEYMYSEMKQFGFTGLEIAPTRLFPSEPYIHGEDMTAYAARIDEKYSISVSSVQSLWYGKSQSLFGGEEDRSFLTEYTKRAIDFTACAGSKNIVFGCPKNRNIPDGKSIDEIFPFFIEAGNYAYLKGIKLNIEAIPTMYNTNCINTTGEAAKLIERLGCPGLGINLDTGTMIENSETAVEVEKYFPYINHVHISEPGLMLIEKRGLHRDIAAMLRSSGYEGYVSVEMRNRENTDDILRIFEYINEIF